MKRWASSYKKWTLVLFACVLALTGVLSPLSNRADALVGKAAPNEDNTTFLPMMTRGYPLKTIFGSVFESLTADKGLDQMADAGTNWARIFLPWADIEPTEGTRKWNSHVELQLLNARANNIRAILIVEQTPSWALQPGSSCGIVDRAKFGAMQNFIRDAVKRYGTAPYHVEHWEMWNEPDVDSYLGCWGDQDDPYYGGGYYAEMLKAAYPTIKQVDPSAHVFVGGLLLDCDPRANSSCLPGRFLEGILLNDGGNYFDGVSFHAYDYYFGSLGVYSNSNWSSSWNTTGPVVIRKAEFIRELLADPRFNVQGKSLINTEGALLCDTCTNNTTFENTKAYYVAQIYSAAIAQNLMGNLWYSVLGWRNSGLLNADLSPKPAYTAFQTAQNQLQSAVFTGNPSFPGVTVYEFNRNGQKIWVAWSQDGLPHNITLPSTPASIVDALGNAEVVNGTALTVNVEPLYVVWNP